MRQIPYTMMKFACFERTVEALYKYVVPKPRSECTKSEQLVVTFAAGYIAGVFCAVVSHPADTVVSKLNNDVGSTPIQAARDLGMKGKLETISLAVPCFTMHSKLCLCWRLRKLTSLEWRHSVETRNPQQDLYSSVASTSTTIPQVFQFSTAHVLPK